MLVFCEVGLHLLKQGRERARVGHVTAQANPSRAGQLALRGTASLPSGVAAASPVPIKLCANLNGLVPPEVSPDVPIERVDERALVQRLDVETARGRASQRVKAREGGGECVPHRCAAEKDGCTAVEDMVACGRPAAYKEEDVDC